MAVFTEVPFEQAQQFLAPFELGTLTGMQGITSGIENTNYFITTSSGQYVLTLFERLSFEQLPFYLQLMKHLAGKGIAVPAPQPHRRGAHAGEILHRLAGKPAAVVERLLGHPQLAPQVHHCAQLGHELANMHLAGADFPLSQPNLRGLDWITQTIPQVLPFLSGDQRALIEDELHYQHTIAESETYKQLLRGPVHADLFRDNAMFSDDAPAMQKLSGIFDFYFAGVDTLIFDMAVCLNDWCIDLQSGALDLARADAFVRSYNAVRQLSAIELELLPAMLRAGALRFWTSRLWDFYLPRQAQLLKPHDPTHFERILRLRVHAPWHWQPCHRQQQLS